MHWNMQQYSHRSSSAIAVAITANQFRCYHNVSVAQSDTLLYIDWEVPDVGLAALFQKTNLLLIDQF